MRTLLMVPALMVVAGLVGCDRQPHEPVQEPAQQNLLQPQVDALNKAKAVEGQVQEMEQQRQQAMDENGG